MVEQVEAAHGRRPEQEAEWRLEHWHMGLADLPALVTRRHRLLHTTDTALYGLTPEGAHALSRQLHTHPHVYYASLTCCVTATPSGADEQVSAKGSLSTSCSLRPIPSGAVARPWHVTFAAVGAATARDPCERHSDGLVPTCAHACVAFFLRCKRKEFVYRRET